MALNKRVRRRLVLLSALIVVIIGVLVILFAISRWNREREIVRSTNEGLAAYKAGDYLTALPLLSYAVTHRRDNLELALALGDTRLRNIEATMRHILAAEKYYLHALSLDPGNEEATRALLKIYVATGDLRNVLTYSERLPEGDSEAILARISVLRFAGRLSEATDEIAKLRQFSPDDTEWPVLEFSIRTQNGESIASMLSLLETYEAEYPNNQGVAFIRIPLLRSARQPNDAILAATELANLPSLDSGIIVQLLQQLEVLQLRDEADLVLERANMEAQKNADIAFALVDRLWRRGRYLEATDLALEAAEAFPDDLRFLRIAAVMAAFQEDVDSEEIHERLILAANAEDTAQAQIDQFHVDALRAIPSSTPEDIRKGVDSIQAGRALDPRNMQMRFVEAELLNKLRQTDAAMNAYQEVFQRSGSRAAGVRLTNLLLQSQRNKEALQYAQQLFSIYPALDIYLIKTRAWIALGRTGQDPGSFDREFEDGTTITQKVLATYQQARKTMPRGATALLPLIAEAAALEEDDAALDMMVQEALQNEYSTPDQIISILRIEDARGGENSDALLQLANTRGATAFQIALVLAQQARANGDEVAAIALLVDATEQLPSNSRDESAELRQMLAFIASTPVQTDDTVPELERIFERLPQDPAAARIISSYPGIWANAPELAQKSLDQLEALLGKESSAYVIANARRVINVTPNDAAARAASLIALDDVLIQSPGSVESMLLMADLLRGGDSPDLSGAANYLRRALDTRPDQIQLYPTLIQLLQQVGDRERALEFLNRYQELASDTSAARSRVALFIRQGELAKAIDELRIVADASKDPLDRIALAQFLAREVRLDEALLEYDRALELDAGNRFALDGKILLLAATGRLPEALQIIQQSPVLDARDQLVMTIEANLAASRQDVALALSNRLIESSPEVAATWILAGRVRAQNGDIPGARNALRQALELDPDNTLAASQLVPLLVAQSESWDEARGLLPQLQQSSPALAAVLELTMATSNPENGSFEPDADALTRSLDISRQYPGALGPRRLAWTLHASSGDHAGAMKIAQDAMAAMPSNPIPAKWAFESAIQDRNWEDALGMAYEIRNRAPAGRRLLEQLRIADLCLRLGRSGEALIALQDYLSIINDDAEIYTNVTVSERSADASARMIPRNLRVLLLQTLLANGRVELAANTYQDLFQDKPDFIALWLSIVPSMEPSDGRIALERVEPIALEQPNGLVLFAQAWIELAAATRDDEDVKRARALLEAVEARNPGDRGIFLNKARLAQSAGDHEQAIEIHREMLGQFTPEELKAIRSPQELSADQQKEVAVLAQLYATALNNLAFQQTLVENGDLDEALSRINEGLALAPPVMQPDLLDTKATVLTQMGDNEAASKAIDDAIARAPNRVDFRITAIRILIDLGQQEEARTLAQDTLNMLTARLRTDPEQLAELRLLIEEIG